MSSDLKDATQTADATGQCATSESRHPAASGSASGTMTPTSKAMSPTPSPMRVRTLAPLLTRENVKAILGVSGVRSVSVRVTFNDGTTDSKAISLAEGGSLALLLLDDNPDRVPTGAFYDIKPA